MKITYTHEFFATCPNGGQTIAYTLLIESEKTIPVEHIVTACAMRRSGFHERIATQLADQFPGTRQTLRAHHHGVDIETVSE